MATRSWLSINGFLQAAHRPIIAVVLEPHTMPGAVFGPKLDRDRDPGGDKRQQ